MTEVARELEADKISKLLDDCAAAGLDWIEIAGDTKEGLFITGSPVVVNDLGDTTLWVILVDNEIGAREGDGAIHQLKPGVDLPSGVRIDLNTGEETRTSV